MRNGQPINLLILLTPSDRSLIFHSSRSVWTRLNMFDQDSRTRRISHSHCISSRRWPKVSQGPQEKTFVYICHASWIGCVLEDFDMPDIARWQIVSEWIPCDVTPLCLACIACSLRRQWCDCDSGLKWLKPGLNRASAVKRVASGWPFHGVPSQEGS